MQCPKCSGAVRRDDMVTALDWTSFVCPGCRVDLEATRASGAIIVAAAVLVGSVVHLAVASLGVGIVVSLIADGTAFFVSAHVGFGNLATLQVRLPDHPSLLP